MQPLKDYEHQIPQSRYGYVDMFLSKAGAAFNDAPILYKDEHMKILLDKGKISI